MAKAKRNGGSAIPNLANATPGFLADELGKVREEKKKLEKLEGIYKQALLARLEGSNVCEGELFSCLVDISMRTSLDTGRVKEEMGEDWYQERCRATEVTTVRTTRKTQ